MTLAQLAIAGLASAGLASAGLACSNTKSASPETPEPRVVDAAVHASGEGGAAEDSGAKPDCSSGMPDQCPERCVGQLALVPGLDGGCSYSTTIFCGVPLGYGQPAAVCVVGADAGVVVFPEVMTEQGLNGGRRCSQDEVERTFEWTARRCD